MRELPKPDHTESEQMSEDGQDWVRYVDMFTRDQVLAIQKQAYEDGLRDAAEKIEQQHRWITAPAGAALIYAMLTASQKEQQ